MDFFAESIESGSGVVGIGHQDIAPDGGRSGGDTCRVEEPLSAEEDLLGIGGMDESGGEDVWEMAEASEDLGFPLKAGDEIGPAHQLRADEFQSNVALEAGLEGLVDVGHAALAQRFDDPVSTQWLTDEMLHLLSPVNIILPKMCSMVKYLLTIDKT